MKTMSSRLSPIDDIIEMFRELKRLHQLNLELIEQLCVTSDWLLEHNIPIPNPSSFVSLLNKAKALLIEIQANEPNSLQYTTSRRKVTDWKENDGTDGEVPKSYTPLFIL